MAARTSGVLPELPTISALFLIDFDVKAGYTIIWKRAAPGLELDGVVEYKSLPSGLHTVSEDLIYFVHEEGYAGLSAFFNAPTTDEESRHARMIAVGVLVPLSYGRLGRAWRHAEGLKAMAAKLAADGKETHILDEYWEKCGTRDPSRKPDPIKDSPMASPALGKRILPGNGHARDRSVSEAPNLMQPGHRLSPHHPAWSLDNLLDTFGPLVFPIHRAALLRRRILISTHAPVNEVCNFVYNISILANVPTSVLDLLDPHAPSQRLRPLFTIGVHDIPFLIADKASKKSGRGPGPEQPMSPLGDATSGWIACTTDSILAIKDDLWDMLITLPPTHTANAQEKVWPTVESPKGIPVRATQRDLRRFRTLKSGLRRISTKTSIAVVDDEPQPQPQQQQGHTETTNGTSSRHSAPTHRMSSSSLKTHFLDEDSDTSNLADAAEKIIEPMTWAALAYSGFMWWASAGEQRRSDETEETAHDNGLLADLIPSNPSPANHPPQVRRSSGSFNVTGLGVADSVTSLTARRAPGAGGDDPTVTRSGVEDGQEEDEEEARRELGIITYFHRLTAGVLGTLAEVVASQDDGYSEFEPSRPQSEDGAEGQDDSEQLLPQTGRCEDEDNELDFRPQVRVDSDALAAMGLDVWSHADAEFVGQVLARYFNRRARVEGKGVEVCGLRVC